MSKTRRFRFATGGALAALVLFTGLVPVVAGETPRPYRPPVPGTNGLVTSDHPLASTAGLQILLRGGNAADAVVAVQAVLHVVRPQMSGASGNGFFTVLDQASGQVYNLSATGAAPKALYASRLSPEQLSRGIQAGVVPGLFGGWIALLDRFGSMNLAEVLAQAIDYAENGHPIEESVAGQIAALQDFFSDYPTSLRVFLPKGRPPVPGEHFRMPDLARTFRLLAAAEQQALQAGRSRSQALQAAFDRFYRGDIAEEMARFYRENGGAFTLEDFAAYKPRWREPLRITYRNFEIYTSPPTSRGGLEVAMQLNLVEEFDLVSLGHDSPELIHLLAEAIKVTKTDVYRYAADPELFEVPIRALLSKEYASERRNFLDLRRASPYQEPGNPSGRNRSNSRSPAVGAGSERAEIPLSAAESTATLAVADRWGNVIAAVPTHGSFFGAGVVVGNTGLTFNNGTRLGSTAPDPDHVNFARGGQVPLLNNSPTVVLEDGRFRFAVGTPGGEGIGQTQFQVLINVLDFGMGVQEAVEAPRFILSADPSFYKPGADILMHLEGREDDPRVEELKRRGWNVRTTSLFDMRMGSMLGILLDPETEALHASGDPRRVGYAVGW